MASREAMEFEKARMDAAHGAGNGAQTGFATGATRSTDAGKIDFEGHINPEVQAIYGDYMNRHRVQRDGRVRASDNWQQGIPIYRYVKSLVRHTFEFWRMWRGNFVKNPDNGQFFTIGDVLCAIRFNIDGLILEMHRATSLQKLYVTKEMREWNEQSDQPKNLIGPTLKEALTHAASEARSNQKDVISKTLGGSACARVACCDTPGDCIYRGGSIS